MYNYIYFTGQPVAWALSDKEDTDTLEAVWTVIKKRCPHATVTTLMTDDGKQGRVNCIPL